MGFRNYQPKDVVLRLTDFNEVNEAMTLDLFNDIQNYTRYFARSARSTEALILITTDFDAGV